MNALRLIYAAGLLLFIALPLLLPLRELIQPGAWSWTEDDIARLRGLSWNTLQLCAGTITIALPIGTALAVLMFRTSFLARRVCLFLNALLLFVPLPVIVSSWQGMFGADGWLPLEWLRGSDVRPWTTGMGPAIWIHAVSAIPWAAFIVGQGLAWVEPELEEHAGQLAGPWRTLALVTLPRVRASIMAAALFVVLQTAGEISVTDMMLVSTLAEETHTQFTAGDNAALARTMLIFMPMLLAVWAAVMVAIWRIEGGLPSLTPPTREARPLELGTSWLRPIVAIVLLAVLCAPLVSLIWKLGLTGQPRHWELGVAEHYLRAEATLLGRDLIFTLIIALLTGIFVATQALIVGWLARDSVWFRWFAFGVLTWAWVMPGPIVGIDLHELIMQIVRVFPDGVADAVLYRGPSPVPLMWVQTIRVLPIAVVFLWPVVRMIPRELIEEARLAGAGPIGMLLHVVAPSTWRAVAITAIAAGALCLAEVGATTRVETPGWESFTKLIFDRMHYGVDQNLAAVSVLMLASLLVLTAIVAAIGWIARLRA